MWDLIKRVLILSHGNASLESGFSINKDLCTVNMQEESTVNQCVVYDEMLSQNMKMKTSKLQSKCSTVKGARKMHESALGAKRITADTDQQESATKRKIEAEDKQLECEKKEKEHEFQIEAHVLEEEIKKKRSRMK